MNEEIRAAQRALSALPAVQVAYVFGSIARGQATERSDLDIAVLTSTPLDLSTQSEILAALERESRREVDFVDLRRAPPLLLREILSEGVVVISRDEDVRAEFELQSLSTVLDTEHLRAVQRGYLRQRAEARLADQD